MTLKPVPPFVWPEARVITGVRTYERHPPWENLALTATALIGIGSALIEVIRNSLDLLGISAFWQGTFVGCFIIVAATFDRIRALRSRD